MSKLFVLLLAASLVVLAHSKSDVVDLEPRTFDKLVLGSDLPYMVEFYAPWCGHCKRLAPEWEKAATNLKDLLPVGRVDCTVHQNLCSKYKVNGYPTIKLFSDKGSNVYDYNQAREAPAIVRYALDAVKGNVHQLTTEKSLESFYQTHPDRPHVILFTSKDKPTPLYKIQQIKYKDQIVFGFVSEKSKDLVNHFKVTSFPALLQVTPGEANVLDGASTSEGLRAALATLAKSTAPPKDSQGSGEETKKPSSPKPKAAAQTWVSVTLDSIETECRDTACVLAIADQSNADQKALLDALLVAYGREKRFKLAVSSDDIKKKFHLESEQGPLLLVYNAKRQHYARADEFTQAGASRLLDRVIGGDVKYTKIDTQAEL